MNLRVNQYWREERNTAVKLSIVIPARDEEGNIGATLNTLRECLQRHDVPYEILVVDDGSQDRTAAIVQQESIEDTNVRLVTNNGPHGFGHAVRAGLDHFTGDAVVIMMADCSDSPHDLMRYYYILRDEADCAFGSRFIMGSAVVDYPLHKLVINRIANTFISRLFGMRFNDVTNAFKGYRSYVIDGCRPFLSPHFNLTVELPLKAFTRGYSHKVVPISWTNRKTGISKLKLREAGSRYLFIVLNVWLEKMLTHGDYHRPHDEEFIPWSITRLQTGTRRAQVAIKSEDVDVAKGG